MKRLFTLLLIAFVALFFVYYYKESSLLTSDDKKWLSDNGENQNDLMNKSFSAQISVISAVKK